jgi:hypothetical protein
MPGPLSCTSSSTPSAPGARAAARCRRPGCSGSHCRSGWLNSSCSSSSWPCTVVSPPSSASSARSTPFCTAGRASSRPTCWARAASETGEGGALPLPCSMRARVSRRFARWTVESVVAAIERTIARMAAGSFSRSASSAWVLSTVSGVRSWCEASAMKRRWLAIRLCMRAMVPFIAATSGRTSRCTRVSSTSDRSDTCARLHHLLQAHQRLQHQAHRKPHQGRHRQHQQGLAQQGVQQDAPRQRTPRVQRFADLDQGDPAHRIVVHRLQQGGDADRLAVVVGVVEAHQGRIQLGARHVLRHRRQVVVAGHGLAVQAADPVVDAAQGIGLEAVQRHVGHVGHDLAVADRDPLGQRARRRQQRAVVGDVGGVERVAVQRHGVQRHQRHQRHDQPAQQLAAQAAERRWEGARRGAQADAHHR